MRAVDESLSQDLFLLPIAMSDVSEYFGQRSPELGVPLPLRTSTTPPLPIPPTVALDALEELVRTMKRIAESLEDHV